MLQQRWGPACTCWWGPTAGQLSAGHVQHASACLAVVLLHVRRCQPAAMARRYEDLMLGDFLHPSQLGHRLMADLALFHIREAMLDLALHPRTSEEHELLAQPLPDPMYPGEGRACGGDHTDDCCSAAAFSGLSGPWPHAMLPARHTAVTEPVRMPCLPHRMQHCTALQCAPACCLPLSTRLATWLHDITTAPPPLLQATTTAPARRACTRRPLPQW